jgi:hypothetical protein
VPHRTSEERVAAAARKRSGAICRQRLGRPAAVLSVKGTGPLGILSARVDRDRDGAVKRNWIGLIVIAIVAIALAVAVAARPVHRASEPPATTDSLLGVVARSGECVLLDFYNVGGSGQSGPQSPLAAIGIVDARAQGLRARPVGPRTVVFEKRERGKTVAAYEVQLFDRFAPTAWMVTRSARSARYDVAASDGPPPEVPPIPGRPDEPPS